MSELAPAVTASSFGTYVPRHPARARSTTPPTDAERQLRKQAEQLVAQTFYGPLLKEVRNSPFKSKLFDGGRGGEAFGSLLDQQLASRSAHGSAGSLVDAIVRKFQSRADAVAARHGGTLPAAATFAPSLPQSGTQEVKK